MPASEGSGTPGPPQVACDNCRQLKVRCTRASAHGSCARCSRLQIECAQPRLARRRGRPSKASRRSTEGPTSPHAPVHDTHHPQLQTIHPTPVTPATSSARGSLAAVVSPDHSVPQASLDLSQYLHPAEGSNPQAPFFHARPSPNGPVRVTPATQVDPNDPVNLQILNSLEAEWLVRQFHHHLNPLVGCLDPELHTVAFLRSNSVALFCAILAISAKYYRTDLFPSLFAHAQILNNRSLLSGISSIGTVQATLILTYWKSPKDTSATVRLAAAIRMAFHFMPHVVRTEGLPQDLHAARRILDTERTWLSLYCADRSLSHTCGLPPLISSSHIGDATRWVAEHHHLGESCDPSLAASISLIKIRNRWVELIESAAVPSAYLEQACDSLRGECESLLERWESTQAPAAIKEYNSSAMVDTMLTFNRYLLDLAPDDWLRRERCLLSASQLVQEIVKLAKRGTLRLMKDTSACMASSLALFLRKIYPNTDVNQKSVILSLLQQMFSSYSDLAGQDRDTPSAYVATFIGEVIKRVEGPINIPQAADYQSLGGLTQDFVDFFQSFADSNGDLSEFALLNSADNDIWNTVFQPTLLN